MKCSVCTNEIREKYCSICGQYFKDSRVTSITILWGLFESFFSLEKSIFMNIKIALNDPKTIVSNYWNGFRKYYFTPFQFFTIASLSLLINYYLFNNFLGLSLSVNNISSHFAVLGLNIILFTLFSTLSYLKFKKNIFEHLILNIYNVSLWTILFVPISISLSLVLDNTDVARFFFIPFHLLILIWNSKAFELSKLKRFLFVITNLSLFYGTLLSLIYYSNL